MYKSFSAIIICIGCYFISLPAFADKWNYGFKLAYFEADAPNVDDPDNAGFVLGYDWVKDYGTVGIEGDFTTTFEDGRAVGEDVSVDTFGAYAVYKTQTFSEQGVGFYLKFKAGVVYYDISAGPASEDDVDASVGFGMGMNMGYVAFEIDYATMGDQEMVNFAVLY